MNELNNKLNQANDQEMTDEELAGIEGGLRDRDGKLIVSVLNCCEYWTCKQCGAGCNTDNRGLFGEMYTPNCHCNRARCNTCGHCSYERGLWLCSSPDRR